MSYRVAEGNGSRAGKQRYAYVEEEEVELEDDYEYGPRYGRGAGRGSRSNPESDESDRPVRQSAVKYRTQRREEAEVPYEVGRGESRRGAGSYRDEDEGPDRRVQGRRTADVLRRKREADDSIVVSPERQRGDVRNDSSRRVVAREVETSARRVAAAAINVLTRNDSLQEERRAPNQVVSRSRNQTVAERATSASLQSQLKDVLRALKHTQDECTDLLMQHKDRLFRLSEAERQAKKSAGGGQSAQSNSATATPTSARAGNGRVTPSGEDREVEATIQQSSRDQDSASAKGSDPVRPAPKPAPPAKRSQPDDGDNRSKTATPSHQPTPTHGNSNGAAAGESTTETSTTKTVVVTTTANQQQQHHETTDTASSPIVVRENRRTIPPPPPSRSPAASSVSGRSTPGQGKDPDFLGATITIERKSGNGASVPPKSRPRSNTVL